MIDDKRAHASKEIRSHIRICHVASRELAVGLECTGVKTTGQTWMPMVFSSLTFLCVFLPVTFILYVFLRSTAARNWLLIAASLVFYAFGEPVYILLMLASTVANWLLGRLMARSEGGRRKAFVIFG